MTLLRTRPASRFTAALIAGAAIPVPLMARPGELRATPASVVERPGDVLAASVAEDGSVTLAGLFSRVNDTAAPGLAKLAGDGSVDGSFVPGIGIAPPSTVSMPGGATVTLLPCPVFQPIGGGMELIGDPPGCCQAWGDLPVWFVLGPGGQPVNGVFEVIAAEEPVMPQFVEDGKLVAIVSSPDEDTGLLQRRVRRLRLDTGVDDPGFFAEGDGTPSQVRPAAAGGLWVLENEALGGAFRLKRLRENGAMDESFTPQPVAGSSALLQSMTGGGLAVNAAESVWDGSLSGTWSYRLQFLAADGTPGSERVQQGGSPPFFIEPNGALLLEEGGISGPVSVLPEARPRTLWRELPGGTRDAQFQNIHTTRLLHRLADGRLLADGTQRYLPNGTPDSTWHAPAVRDHGIVRALFAGPGGGVIAAGEFTQVDGQPRPGLARWRADGSLDTGFLPASAAGDVRDCVVAPDGSVTVLRREETVSHLQRLRPDGTVDASFILTKPETATFPLDAWEEIEPLPGGAVLALVQWRSGLWGRTALVRISPQGDCTELSASTIQVTNGSGLMALPDGRYFHAGRRWLANGAIDATFTSPGGIGSVPLCAAGTGSWIFLRSANGPATPVLVRDNGSLDDTFQPDNTQPAPAVAAGGAGRSIIFARNGEIIRLYADGRRDSTFLPLSLDRRNESIPDGLPLLSAVRNGGPGTVHSLLMHPDTGELWLAGDFTRAGSVLRSGIARMDASVPAGFANWSDAIFNGAAEGTTEADPDGDGAANWQEYAAGSDPLRADAAAVSAQILTTHPLCVSAPLNPAATEVFQSLEISADLRAWHSATGAEAVRKTVNGRPAFELASGAGPRFVRIRYRSLP